jgi:hypothetical protein
MKCTRWFKYDQDKLWLVYTQIVPVIFEPPCIYPWKKDKVDSYPDFIYVSAVIGKRNGNWQNSCWHSNKNTNFLFFLRRNSPNWAKAAPLVKFLHAPGMTPLNEWPARGSACTCTGHKKHKRGASMPSSNSNLRPQESSGCRPLLLYHVWNDSAYFV